MKHDHPNYAALKSATRHAIFLINTILQDMIQAHSPGQVENPQWQKMNDTRQSMVANVAKLVQALAILSRNEGKNKPKGQHREEQVTQQEDLALLHAWLREQKRLSGS